MENRIFELIDIIDNEIQDSNASMVQAVNIGKHIDELKAKLKQVKKLKDDVSKSFYCEQDMLNAAKYGYEYRDTTSFPEMDFDSNCKNNTIQWLTTVK